MGVNKTLLERTRLKLCLLLLLLLICWACRQSRGKGSELSWRTAADTFCRARVASTSETRRHTLQG